MVFKVKIFPKNCSCGNPLGIHQKIYEDEVISIYNSISTKDIHSLRQSQNQALDNLEWFKICCRNCVWNGSAPLVLDSSFGSYKNEIQTESILNRNQTQEFIYKSKPEIVPRRKVPEFQDLPSKFENINQPVFEKKQDNVNRDIFNIISSNIVVYLPQRKNKKIIYK
jgi:DNA-directed RNA polymerase subunit N (RpoN/RPB10)